MKDLDQIAYETWKQYYDALLLVSPEEKKEHPTWEDLPITKKNSVGRSS